MNEWVLQNFVNKNELKMYQTRSPFQRLGFLMQRRSVDVAVDRPTIAKCEKVVFVLKTSVIPSNYPRYV